jgi:uncharacterized protein YkwD
MVKQGGLGRVWLGLFAMVGIIVLAACGTATDDASGVGGSALTATATVESTSRPVATTATGGASTSSPGTRAAPTTEVLSGATSIVPATSAAVAAVDPAGRPAVTTTTTASAPRPVVTTTTVAPALRPVVTTTTVAPALRPVVTTTTLAPAPRPVATTTTTTPVPPPAPVLLTCSEVGLGDVNGWRGSLGYGSLSRSGSLYAGACEWAKTMAKNGTLSHGSGGEVIARVGSCGAAIGAWQYSPSHYAVLTGQSFTSGAIACVVSDGRAWVVGRVSF